MMSVCITTEVSTAKWPSILFYILICVITLKISDSIYTLADYIPREKTSIFILYKFMRVQNHILNRYTTQIWHWLTLMIEKLMSVIFRKYFFLLNNTASRQYIYLFFPLHEIINSFMYTLPYCYINIYKQVSH